MMRLRHAPFLARMLAAVALLALFAAFAAAWPGMAQAREPSRCGEQATGLRADGTPWTGAAPRMWVGRDGYWHICQPWVSDGGDPEAPAPATQASCRPGIVIERWQQDGRECLAPGLLPTGKAGQAIVLMDDEGATRGMAAFRCRANPHIDVGAEWVMEGSYCRWLYPPVDPAPRAPRPLGGDARVGPASWPGR